MRGEAGKARTAGRKEVGGVRERCMEREVIIAEMYENGKEMSAKDRVAYHGPLAKYRPRKRGYEREMQYDE